MYFASQSMYGMLLKILRKAVIPTIFVVLLCVGYFESESPHTIRILKKQN